MASTEANDRTDAAARFAQASISDPEILKKPNAYYEYLRTSEPVHYDEKLKMYVVSRYEDLQAILTDTEAFSLELGYHTQFAKGFHAELVEILERDGGGYFPDVIMSDPPKHTRIRRLMEKAFTAHRMKQLEPAMSAYVGGMIDKLADRGGADGIRDFAIPMTIGLMCEQLGLHHADGDKVNRWSQAYTAQMGILQSREQMIGFAEQICELQHYIIARIREREADPREDMISDLVHARLDDEDNPRLSTGEAISLVRALLAGGNKTTTAAIGNLLLTLATQPEVTDRLTAVKDDDRLLNRFVEELLRVEPPVRGLSRVTTREVELAGTLLPKGAHVLLLFASANDDEGTFPNARAFDLERTNIAKHLSFGAGIHRCVGIALARMEVKVAAREIANRLQDIRLAIAPEDIPYVRMVSTLGIESLPLTFSRRPAA